MLVMLLLGTLLPQPSPTGLWIPLAPSKVQSGRVQFGSITISLFYAPSMPITDKPLVREPI